MPAPLVLRVALIYSNRCCSKATIHCVFMATAGVRNPPQGFTINRSGPAPVVFWSVGTDLHFQMVFVDASQPEHPTLGTILGWQKFFKIVNCFRCQGCLWLTSSV